jgi:hypothetical protein
LASEASTNHPHAVHQWQPNVVRKSDRSSYYEYATDDRDRAWTFVHIRYLTSRVSGAPHGAALAFFTSGVTRERVRRMSLLGVTIRTRRVRECHYKGFQPVPQIQPLLR